MNRHPAATVTATVSGLVLALATLVLGAAPAAAGAARTSDPPTNLRVADLGPTSLAVAWDMPDGADYSIVRVSRTGYGLQQSELSHGESASFTGLLWDTEYSVTVTAYYTKFKDERFSAASDPLTVRTPAPDDFEVPNAATNLRIERDSSGNPEFLLFDASTEGFGDLWYDLHLNTSEVPGMEDLSGVWASTNEQRFDLSFVPITAEIWQPGDTVRVFITATDGKGNVSAPSEALELTCCPF